MDLVTRLRYRSSTDVYPRDTALTLMGEAADEIIQLRGKLSLAGEGLANAMQELQELKRALNFWLPMVPKDAPLDENECLNRIERDARLLFKYDGESDEKCAMELGWVSLRVPQSGLPSDKA